jgi:hypothetical protein
VQHQPIQADVVFELHELWMALQVLQALLDEGVFGSLLAGQA